MHDCKDAEARAMQGAIAEKQFPAKAIAPKDAIELVFLLNVQNQAMIHNLKTVFFGYIVL